MKGTKQLPLIAVMLALVSCNEKISPELQNANSSSTLPSPTLPMAQYTFKVVDDSPVMLNYQIHRTGAGNGTSRCEVSKNVPLTNNIFRFDPESDITCFFEAQELSLFHSGMGLKVEATPNTCEFVAYEPFGFFNRIPGDSSTTMYEVSCSENTNNGHLAGLPSNLLDAIETNSGLANCGEMVDANFTGPTRESFIIGSDSELCRFNYQDEDKEMCDIGVITVNTIHVSFDTTTGLSYEVTPRTIRCEGKVSNCVAGPAKTMIDNSTRIVEYTDAPADESFSKSYTYSGLIRTGEERRFTNREYVNFRRDLSSLYIDFGNPENDYSHYIAAFGNPTHARNYTPNLMDRYSRNQRMNGTPLIDNTTWANHSAVRDGSGNLLYTAVPLAAEPFMGLGNFSVNPFYTYYCLDRALDIKARIRVVVRDWDRVFPSTSSSMELISDINLGISARMDMGLTYVEIDHENDYLMAFNDKLDWDDFIPMDRTLDAGTGYDPAITIWRPATTSSSYPLGFFNPVLFPGHYGDL